MWEMQQFSFSPFLFWINENETSLFCLEQKRYHMGRQDKVFTESFLILFASSFFPFLYHSFRFRCINRGSLPFYQTISMFYILYSIVHGPE